MADKTEHQQEKAAAGQPRDKAERAETGREAQTLHDATQDGPSAESENESSGFADPLEFLRAELDRLEAEKADTQDKMVRLAAEMDNLRKRTAKDVADAREYSIASFAREMLAVSDNLRRALEAIPQETREAADAVLVSLIQGVELTERGMVQALEKHGVRRISPLDEKFDPNFHQAMFEVPNTEVPNNTVVQVVQDGYVIGDRVLRPALVGVSKGGPKQSPNGEARAAAGEAGESAGGN